MKLKLIMPLIFLISCSFVKKDELYLNYLASINNEGSTFQYYLVIKIKNLNTGEIREICTDANGLLGALHREQNVDYDEKSRNSILSLAKNNKQRYFEFKNQEALNNLGVQYYSTSDLEKLEKKIDFDSLANQIIKSKKWSMRISGKQMTMYAHALFNRKILTGENNCMGGTLHFVDRNNQEF